MKLSGNQNLKITSRDNERIKIARKTRDGDEERIFIEGLRLVEEALRADLKISDIFFTENFAKNQRHRDFLNRASRFNLNEISDKVFDSLADTKTSQGVVLIARKPSTGKDKIEANLVKDAPLVVVLHRINNPSNLGAILRTAEAADVSGIIVTGNSADAFSPKALRGAMGAAFRLPLWTDAEFSEVLRWARERNLISVAADVKAEKSYSEIDWNKPRLLIFGSEAHGLSSEETAKIEEMLKIPMANGVESLNLAASAAVILFEARRQRSG